MTDTELYWIRSVLSLMSSASLSFQKKDTLSSKQSKPYKANHIRPSWVSQTPSHSVVCGLRTLLKGGRKQSQMPGWSWWPEWHLGGGQRLGWGCSCDSLRVYDGVADDPKSTGGQTWASLHSYFYGKHSHSHELRTVTEWTSGSESETYASIFNFEFLSTIWLIYWIFPKQVSVLQQGKTFRQTRANSAITHGSIKNNFPLSVWLLCLCVRVCVRTNLSMLPNHLLSIQWWAALSMGYWGKQRKQKL